MRNLMICALYEVPESFISLKVQPICEDGNGGYMVTDENHAKFFSLSAVSPKGVLNCIGEFQSERDANKVKRWIEKLVSKVQPEFLQPKSSLLDAFKIPALTGPYVTYVDEAGNKGECTLADFLEANTEENGVDPEEINAIKKMKVGDIVRLNGWMGMYTDVTRVR